MLAPTVCGVCDHNLTPYSVFEREGMGGENYTRFGYKRNNRYSEIATWVWTMWPKWRILTISISEFFYSGSALVLFLNRSYLEDNEEVVRHTNSKACRRKTCCRTCWLSWTFHTSTCRLRTAKTRPTLEWKTKMVRIIAVTQQWKKYQYPLTHVWRLRD